jgi:hypothetical protein
MLKTGSKGYLIAATIALGACLSLPSADLHSAAKVQKQTKIQKQARCKRCKERPLSPQKEQRVYHNFYKKSESSRRAMGGESSSSGPNSVSSRGVSVQKVSFPRPTYTIKEDTSRLGDIVVIKDGTEWSVRESHREIVKGWEIGQPIAFTPNLSTWKFLWGQEPMYKYHIVNLETGESVEANLSKGPFVNSISARRIRRIDKSTGDVFFSDGTLWRCNPKGDDGIVFREWKVGDFLITGRNDTWYSFQNEDIIINVSADNWLPAQRSF